MKMFSFDLALVVSLICSPQPLIWTSMRQREHSNLPIQGGTRGEKLPFYHCPPWSEVAYRYGSWLTFPTVSRVPEVDGSVS